MYKFHYVEKPEGAPPQKTLALKSLISILGLTSMNLLDHYVALCLMHALQLVPHALGQCGICPIAQ